MTVSSYPLRYVPPHPGPKPSRLHPIRRRRWLRIQRERSAAKAWNFMALYGSPWKPGDAPPAERPT